MSVGEIRDRVRGVLVGLAAGDRNGAPIRMAVRLERFTFGRTTNHLRNTERGGIRKESRHETLFDGSSPARRRHPR